MAAAAVTISSGGGGEAGMAGFPVNGNGPDGLVSSDRFSARHQPRHHLCLFMPSTNGQHLFYY